MWKNFMEGGRMSFNVQKTKYKNIINENKLQQMSAFKSV